MSLAAAISLSSAALAGERLDARAALDVSVQVEVEVGGQPDPFAGGGRIAPGITPLRRPGLVAGRGGGAGFVFDPSGLIATNAHVVAGARAVFVRLHDGRRLAATVVGLDRTLDLCLLRIEAGGPLSAARLGDSRQLAEGDQVWAVGAPLGYGFSLSSGVLSGRDRFFDDSYPVRLLQHDAALNPGNSGGPLFDAAGEVVGVNTATPPETIFDIGIGLAIPAEVAGPALRRLATDGRIERGRLGVSVTAADADVAAALGAEGPGLVIDGLADNGGARQAGLRTGDLILRVGGQDTAGARDLMAALLDSRPGETVRVDYVRDGKALTAQVRLDAAPSAGSSEAAERADGPLDLGLTLGRSDWDGGVAVQSVRPDGPAAAYGLRAGDRVRAINGRAVAAAAEAEAALRAPGVRVALLRVERAGEPARHIVLPLTRRAAAERPPGRVIDAATGPL